MSRRAARIIAVEVLYGADVRATDVSELLDDREDVDAYCHKLVNAVASQRAEIDRLIGSHARNWSPERMSVVDRNVLRVGVAELLDGDVPAPAVIDEAVEIAKHFSGADAGRFVNGVLDAVRQELAGGRSSGPSSRSDDGAGSDGAGSDGAGSDGAGSDGGSGATGAGGS